MVDEASADGTAGVARRLARELDEVSVVHLLGRHDHALLREGLAPGGSRVVAVVEVTPFTDLDRVLTPLVARAAEVAPGVSI